MKTTVKNLDKGTYGMTANTKKLLVEIVGMNDKRYFNQKLTANKTKLLIEPKGDNTYKVTQFLSRHSMISAGKYESEQVYNVQLVTK